MITRIIVPKQAIATFRREAIRLHPNEFLQTLWGRIQGDTVLVHAVRSVEHTGSESRVDLLIEDEMAPAVGKDQYLGTLHSHPDTSDASASEADFEDAYATGEHVFGVMRVCRTSDGKFKTSIAWWEPRAPIQMIYPKVRNANKKTVSKLSKIQGDSIPEVQLPAVSAEISE